MARPLRIEFPGAIYHVTSRGNARQAIFLDDDDRRTFFLVLDRLVSRFRIVVHAFCLMDDDFHLLIETPEANLSKAIRQLNGVFTQTLTAATAKWGTSYTGALKPFSWIETATRWTSVVTWFSVRFTPERYGSQIPIFGQAI